MSSSRSVLRVWSLALALSAALAAAGERWPDTLPIRPAAIWALVLLPPLLMVLVLVSGWSLPGAATRQGGESDPTDRENG
ncbi:MAG: hypothetical protein ACKO0M_05930 [Cyanobium sp.]